MRKSSIDSFFEAKKEFINFASSVARLSTAVYNSPFFLFTHFGHPAKEQLSAKLLHRAKLLILHVERQIAFNMEQTIQNRHFRKLVKSAIEMAELSHLQKLDSNSLSRYFDRQKTLDFWNSSRFEDTRINRAIKASCKANGSQKTQRVFSKSFNGRKWSSHKSIM